MKAQTVTLDPWALTFVGGADFAQRKPASIGKRSAKEFLGVNRIAVAREVRAVLARAKSLGSIEDFVAEQGQRARVQGKLPVGADPLEFAKYRLQCLLYLAHKTGAGAAKKRLREALGHKGRYRYPALQVTGVSLDSVAKQIPKVTFESVEEFLARGGSIKIYSSPLTVLDESGEEIRQFARFIGFRNTTQVLRAA